MAEEEERRHERQVMYGYMGQASTGIGHGNKRGAGGGATNVERTKEKAMAQQEAEAQAERELSNRVWSKEDLAHLQRAVEE